MEPHQYNVSNYNPFLFTFLVVFLIILFFLLRKSNKSKREFRKREPKLKNTRINAINLDEKEVSQFR